MGFASLNPSYSLAPADFGMGWLCRLCNSPEGILMSRIVTVARNDPTKMRRRQLASPRPPCRKELKSYRNRASGRK